MGLTLLQHSLQTNKRSITKAMARRAACERAAQRLHSEPRKKLLKKKKATALKIYKYKIF